MTLADPGPEVPVIQHFTGNSKYPGQDCLSMGERSFGRTLAMWENLLAEAGRS